MDDAAKDSAGALSARVEEVLARTVDGPVPMVPDRYDGVRGAELDDRISELASLADLLGSTSPGRERELARVEARIGALTATRYVLDTKPEDLAPARQLLEAARVSQALDENTRRKAHANLLALLVSRLVRLQADNPQLMRDSPNGLRLDDLGKLAEVGMPAAFGGPGLLEDTARLFQLLGDQDFGGMPPELRQQAEIYSAAMEAMRRQDLPGVVAAGERALASDQGPGSLMSHIVNSLAPAAMSLYEDSLTGGGRDAESGGGSGAAGSDPGPHGDGSFDMGALMEIAALADVRDPGTLDPGELPKLIEKLVAPMTGGTAAPLPSRMIATLSHFSLAMRDGDMTRLNEALRLMREAFAGGEFDEEQFTGWLQPVAGSLLAMASMMGGSLQDEELAGAVLRDMDRFAGPRDDRPGGSQLRTMSRIMGLRAELDEAVNSADLARVEDVIAELQELEEGLEGAEAWVRLGPSILVATAYLALARLTQSLDDVRMAVHRFDRVLEEDAGIPPVMRTLLDSTWAPLLALVAFLEKDPDRLAVGLERTRSVLARPGVTFDFAMRIRTGLAIGLRTMYDLTGDTAHLDESVRELRQARTELTPGAPANSSVHGMLAETLAIRAATHDGAPAAAGGLSRSAAEDLRAAVKAARDALRASADTVLLQANTRHALQVAREAADQGRKAALWALRAGDPEEAVGALEAGRSLVLQAAAESSGVADRLQALGADELAGRWRSAASPPRSGAAGTTEESWSPLEVLLLSSPEGGPELPSEVRRESLALLRDRERPVDEPARDTVAALRAGLAHCAADALVLLLPGSGTEDGALLLVTPEGPVRAVPCRELSAEGRAPVTAFLDAGAHRQKLETTDAKVSPQEHNRAERAWTAALGALCDWAGDVLGPVFSELSLWERALGESELADGGSGSTAVRLVLVPCGELGVVPWHAAVLRPPEGRGGPGTVRACEVAVLTHAASGREFLRAAARQRMRPAERPALVFHGYDLDWAEHEVTTLKDVFYPDVTPYAEEYGTPPTPRTVLDLLCRGGDDAASLVHLACHGMAGTDPSTSALQLAPTPEQAEAGEYEGDLALSTILDTPFDQPRPAGRGPLVLCSACETDLTTRDHDEALTVTSVLVHRLATDAVGSRWKVLDGSSEVLMLVLHDRLAAGLAPPDALRAAQRWMLTPPDRRPRVPALDSLTEYRRHEDFRDRPEAWAAFVHQGNPAPAAPAAPAAGRRRQEESPA